MSRAAWYAKSVDSTYLTGKRVYVFGDASHAIAAARVASQEMGFEVVGLGTYSREFAREVRDVLSVGARNPVTIGLRNRHNSPVELTVHDEPPLPSAWFDLPFTVTLWFSCACNCCSLRRTNSLAVLTSVMKAVPSSGLGFFLSRPMVQGPTSAGSLSPSLNMATAQPSSSSFLMTWAVHCSFCQRRGSVACLRSGPPRPQR